MPALEGLATPALVLDRGVFERNLDELAALAGAHGVELLPHAKTHRMAEAGRVQLEHGAHGLTVAKLGEAEAFADAGADRIFVAYPLVGRGNGERALALSERVDLTVGADTVEGARSLGEVFAAAGRTLRVLLAVDTGLGREGVSFDDGPAAAAAIHALDGIELIGIYTHEGSTYSAAPDELVERSQAIAREMVGLAHRIRDTGIPLPVVSLGSSASVRAVAAVPGVTQIRPGIAAFNDLGQIALGNATLETTAVRVLATVTSRTAPDRGCIDAGSKALGADLLPASTERHRYPGHGLIVGHPGWVLDRLSEEHGWLRWTGDGTPSPLPVGTVVEIVPNHVCMVFAALRRAAVLAPDGSAETWDGFGPGSST